jgi:aspartate ammonia-lyase
LRFYTKILDKKSFKYKKILKVGRTHLQDAVPISVGREFGAQSSAIKSGIKQLLSLKENLCCVNMGGTAIGTMVNASSEFSRRVIKRLSVATGYRLKADDDLVYSTQYADVYLQTSSMLCVFATNLIKFLNDLRLLASGPKAGIGEISFQSLQKGSSIMPGKVNPVSAEMLTQIAFQVIGNNQTVTLAVQAGQLELNVMLPIIAKNLIESFEWLTRGIYIFTKNGLSTLVVNKDRCQELLENSQIGITALSKKIGYEKAEQLLKKAEKNKNKIVDQVVEDGIMSREEYKNLLK